MYAYTKNNKIVGVGHEHLDDYICISVSEEVYVTLLNLSEADKFSIRDGRLIPKIQKTLLNSTVKVSDEKIGDVQYQASFLLYHMRIY